MTNENRMELEAKIAVDDLDGLERKLVSLGAERLGRWEETDRFFDFADEKLKRDDSALRLRLRRDIEGQREFRRLTFKGPRQPGRLKIRREIEITVDDIPATADIIEALGMKEFASYMKDRTSLTFGGCTIELDSLDGIGTFIEVEGPDEETIDNVLVQLALAGRPTITESYLSMVLARRYRAT